MAEKTNWIGGAIKPSHKGIEKKKAAEAGISTHQQLEKDSHSSNASVRGRGLLGLRFQKGISNK